MNTEKSGKFLYKYYQKKIDSIIINLSILKKIDDAGCIHKLRVDIKHLRAFYNIYEYLDQTKIDAQACIEIFEKVFKQAGKIREIHLNKTSIGHYGLHESVVFLYKKNILAREEKEVKKLDTLIDKVHFEKAVKLGDKLKKSAKKMNRKKIIQRLVKFLADTIDKIKNMPVVPEAEDLHATRKYFKSISVVGHLLNRVKPSKKLTAYVAELKKSEEPIGKWHNRVMFEKSLRTFLDDNSKADQDLLPVKKMVYKLSIKNKKSIKTLTKKIQQSLPVL
jgi:CHAD domain-containing protein